MNTSPFQLTNARRLASLASVALAFPGHAAQFEDVTAAAGLKSENGYCLGAAWGDYNQDGHVDAYISVGGGSSRVNAFYGNNRDGTFTRVGSETGPIVTDAHDSQGCLWADFDNDGRLDLFVNNGFSSPSPNDFYWNSADGTFRRGDLGPLTQLLKVRSWSACADYNLDGWLDLYTGEAASYPGTFNLTIYRGYATGTFTSLDVGQTSFANDGAWGDFDNDGDPDLFLSNYTGTSGLWRNDRHDKFTRLASIGLPGAGSLVAHAAWADFDRDGDLDLALGRIDDIRLYRNDGATQFVLVQTVPGQIASVAWADYDNDGRMDLLAAGGQDTPRVARLYHNEGGTFRSVTDVFTQVPDYWLACPWGDFDNDGFMDVLFTHQFGENRLYRNVTNTNHWIKFKLTGTASNRDAIGAKVRVQAAMGGQTVWQMQEINGGYNLQNDMRLNFGLGDATSVDRVRIEWPSGNVQELTEVAVDQILEVTELTFITPVRPSGSLGGTVTLTSQRSGMWQWYHDGVALTDRTNRTLTVTNLVTGDAGRYSAVVDTDSEIVTNHVYLLVDTQFSRITTGPVVTDNEDSWGSVWVDFDQDGDVDLFVANGVFVGSQRNALYRNDGQDAFTRLTATEAGPIADDVGNWLMAAWGDVDNDGLPDAFVSEMGRNLTALYRNLGSGMFERRLDLVPATWASGSGPMLADFDHDGWLDWFVGSANPARTNSLYYNLAGHGFAPLATGPIVQDRLGESESGMWGDYDGDGDLDLVITLGAFQPRVRLYENLGSGVFRRAPTTGLEDPLGTGSFPVEAVWGDYDNDLRLDLFVAVYNSTPNVLFHNEGNGVFTRRTMGKGGVEQGHPAWADYDNDGWLDLFLGRGQGRRTPDQLWHNNGDGTFREVTWGSGVTDPGNSEGAAWGDYNNDGFMDLFVANGFVNGLNRLYRNNTNDNHWIKIVLKGTTSNRSAIGAKVKVQATINGRTFWQMREVPGGNRCQDDLRPNFGLGNALAAQTLRIEWPSGTVQEFNNVAANQILTITEPRRPILALTIDSGRVTGTVSGDPGQTYQVQVSGDPTAGWTGLSPVTTGPDGKGSWSDSIPLADAPRFYKAFKTP